MFFIYRKITLTLFFVVFIAVNVVVTYSIFSESASSVKTKCVQIDFSGGLEIYDTISSELSGLEIGILGSVATYYFVYTIKSLLYYAFVVHRAIFDCQSRVKLKVHV